MRTRDKDRRGDYERSKRSSTRSRSPKKSSENVTVRRSRSRRARSASGAKSCSVDDRSVSRKRSLTRRFVLISDFWKIKFYISCFVFEILEGVDRVRLLKSETVPNMVKKIGNFICFAYYAFIFL